MPRANSKKRSRRSQKAVSSASVLLYGLPPTIASLEWKSGEGLKLNHNVDLDDANKQIGKSPGSIRAFIGYAGWGAGQLEAEMKQNAWVIRKPDRATIKLDRLPRLWFDIMNRLGPWFKLLAAAPDDPSLN